MQEGRCGGQEAARNCRYIVFWGLRTVVRKGFAVASRTRLFSTPKFSISLVRPVYLLTTFRVEGLGTLDAEA
jgi:hypothetical protein